MTRADIRLTVSAPDSDYALAELLGWIASALTAVDRTVIVHDVEIEEADA